jgi:methylmalonyl-CoA/ethylmalonyl-CoA epimerase
MPRKLLDGMVLGIDHVGICVGDMDQSAQMWAELLGLPIAHRECVDVQKTEAVFVDPPGHVERGDATVELVAPMPGNVGLLKFLEKRGDGMHHLAFAVTDIRECLRRLDEAGVQLLDKEPRLGARGHLVAFLHPKAMNGTLVELVERHPQHGGK